MENSELYNSLMLGLFVLCICYILSLIILIYVNKRDERILYRNIKRDLKRIKLYSDSLKKFSNGERQNFEDFISELIKEKKG